jgi:MerR family transcriptional regulator, light-induced transcriptional regulator
MNTETAEQIYDDAATVERAVAVARTRPALSSDALSHYGENPMIMPVRVDDPGFHILHLAEALRFDCPELFFDYIGWAKIRLHSLKRPPETLEHDLEDIKRACYSNLSRQTSAPMNALLDRALELLPTLPDTHPSFIEPDNTHAKLARNYLDALLATNQRRARVLILDALKRGVAHHTIFDEVIAPCLREVGLLWQTRRINEAQEHYCTYVTEQILTLIASDIGPPIRRQLVVGLCVAGEQHALGLQLALHCFEINGWSAVALGANTPSRSVDWMLHVWHPTVLAMSVTMTYHLREAAIAIALVRTMPADQQPLIIVGGRPLSLAPDLWQKLGADMRGENCAASIEQINARFGAPVT